MVDKSNNDHKNTSVKKVSRELKHGLSVCIGARTFKGSKLVTVGLGKTKKIVSKTCIIPVSIIDEYKLSDSLFI